jgi:hypothetical protein
MESGVSKDHFKPLPDSFRCGGGTGGDSTLSADGGLGMAGGGFGGPPEFLKLTPESERLGVPELLESMAKTFRERNAIYGDNWNMVGRLMAVMFPNGVKLSKPEDYDVWHLFELAIVKLSRFAVSGLTHKDSVHDMAVYCAMVEAVMKRNEDKGKTVCLK